MAGGRTGRVHHAAAPDPRHRGLGRRADHGLPHRRRYRRSGRAALDRGDRGEHADHRAAARRDVAVLTSSATEQPGVAIIEGYEQVRKRLVDLLGDSGGYRNRNSDINAYELARLAASSGLLDDAVADTVGHITVLRNLATNLSAGRIDAEQATEYVKLVEEVLDRIPA